YQSARLLIPPPFKEWSWRQKHQAPANFKTQCGCARNCPINFQHSRSAAAITPLINNKDNKRMGFELELTRRSRERSREPGRSDVPSPNRGVRLKLHSGTRAQFPAPHHFRLVSWACQPPPSALAKPALAVSFSARRRTTWRSRSNAAVWDEATSRYVTSPAL
ncbi:MAG: hypothetical protein JWM16_1766, partial [Verrucomicrobiales bacterium]|nr:hypothetical protein [Verrucomicrobiales bacterium]